MNKNSESVVKNQLIPLALSLLTFLALLVILFLLLHFINSLDIGSNINLKLRLVDVLFGLTIYLKTAVDFAIFIGHTIRLNPGYKSRIAVEIATAFGNALGTLLILILWFAFKKFDWLLAIMIFLASLVLLRLALEGAEDTLEVARSSSPIYFLARKFYRILAKINKLIEPILGKILPNVSFDRAQELPFWPLFAFAFTIPFILGLDDFAGYVPLFSLVNVFGFATGVFLGHTILNILLYVSPAKTIKAVSHPVISFLGSLVFVGLAVYGLLEVIKILVPMF